MDLVEIPDANSFIRWIDKNVVVSSMPLQTSSSTTPQAMLVDLSKEDWLTYIDVPETDFLLATDTIVESLGDTPILDPVSTVNDLASTSAAAAIIASNKPVSIDGYTLKYPTFIPIITGEQFTVVNASVYPILPKPNVA